jgi:hypothetical protein
VRRYAGNAHRKVRSVANLATSEAFDLRSKEPELKFAAVRVIPIGAAER